MLSIGRIWLHIHTYIHGIFAKEFNEHNDNIFYIVAMWMPS